MDREDTDMDMGTDMDPDMDPDTDTGTDLVARHVSIFPRTLVCVRYST